LVEGCLDELAVGIMSSSLPLAVLLALVLAIGGLPWDRLPADPGAGSLSGGTWTSALTDHLGTGLLTVTDAGSTGTARRVGPYGLARDGTALAPGIGYTGEWSDATGLLNLRARAYDPLLARFVGRDTFGGVASAPQTANRYSYALNNPYRYTDPSGRFIQAAIDHPGEVASFVLSIPVLPGLAIAAWGAVTGTDPLTGRVLSQEERAAGLLFAGFGPFGKALGGVARAAAGRLDDVLGAFLRGLKALPGQGLESLRGLRGRGLGLLGDLGAGLRARYGRGADDVAIGVGRAAGGEAGRTLFNARSSLGVARTVARSINPSRLNPNARFGRAIYLSESPETAIAELRHHGAAARAIVRFRLADSEARILDLTDPSVAARLGYAGGDDYVRSQSIARAARLVGYDAIRYPSLRGDGANYAVLRDFDASLHALGIDEVP
jgi:RHS repeat-associated protein